MKTLRLTTNAAISACIIASLWFPGGTFAQSASASSISFQGALNGSDGKPLANGNNYSLTFKFYDSLTNSSLVGVTNVSGVSVISGVASTQVPVDPKWFKGDTYLGISINNGQELLPRISVSAVPYALIASGFYNPIKFTQEPDVSWVGVDNGSMQLSGFSVQLLAGPSAAKRNVLTGDADGVVVIDSTTGFSLRQRLRDGTDVHHLEIGDNVHFHVLTAADFDDTVSVRTLTIRGADVAEPFRVSPAAPGGEPGGAKVNPKPGMVVAINPDRPGDLMVSNSAYDRRVAGVISGANGLSVGIVMGQDNPCDLIRGDHPVAMCGRVWVFCDATGGMITPGDRLTTSDTPGYAMKAIDRERADGAIIGKAMTELADGKGLVLVLVNLQ